MTKDETRRFLFDELKALYPKFGEGGLTDFVLEAWNEAFRGYSQNEVSKALKRFYTEDVRRILPTTGQLLNILRTGYKDYQDKKTVKENDPNCPRCRGVGRILYRYEHDSYVDECVLDCVCEGMKYGDPPNVLKRGDDIYKKYLRQGAIMFPPKDLHFAWDYFRDAVTEVY